MKTRTKTYTYFTDPGHGWLRVKHKELQELGIADQISPYSYMRGDYAYLEEDCDMTKFMQAKGWLQNDGRVIDGFWDRGLIKHQNCRTRDSAIRSYERYEELVAVLVPLDVYNRIKS